jgi:DNA-binding NtrC family response regulator
MQSQEPGKTVVFVSARKPEDAIEQEMGARGIRVQWANSIQAVGGLLNSALDGTVVVTELALVDGNWRDLLERISSLRNPTPIVLMASASTAELWWDALECGIEDILVTPVSASQLFQVLRIHSQSRNDE